MKPSDLNEFTRHYVLAALWLSDPSPGQGDYTETGLSLIPSVSEDWLKQAIADCERFQLENWHALEAAGTDSQNGHDFWLTRNGHGAGFWDRGYPDEVGKPLSKAARSFGEAYFDWEFDLKHDDETSEA